jgi:glycosyltransferase involved in cell wall biosynthesis
VNSARRVLQVIDDATVGGGQQHLLLLARGLAKRGFEISVACAPEGYLVEELRKERIPCFSIVLRNRVSLESFSKLKAIIKEFNPTILHTHGGTAGLWGRLAAVRGRIPIRLHTHHGLHSLHWRDGARRRAALLVERLLKHITTCSICVSQGEARLGFSHGVLDTERTVVIPNGIEIEKYSSNLDRRVVLEEFGFQEKEIVVGMVGRFHLQKGYEFALRAMPDILSSHSQVRFLLVGEGELLPEMRDLAARLGVGQFVRFAGTRYDVPRLLQAMDIFLLSSLWEGFPLTLLEASAAGKAIIATDVGGNNEIIEAECTGLLIPPRRSEAIAEAVRRLITDQSLRDRLGEAAREKARRQYSAEKMIDATTELYSKLLHSAS